MILVIWVVMMNVYVYYYSDSGLSNRLPAERESYDPVNGVLVAWVQVSVTSASSKVIYIAYGDASISSDPNSDATYGATSVWDANYKGVWHFPNGSSLTLNDSTSSANNGTGTNASAITGQIDGGVGFTGSDPTYVKISAAPAKTLPVTQSAWVKRNTTSLPEGGLEVMIDQGQLSSEEGIVLYFQHINTNGGDSIRTLSRDATTTNYELSIYNLTYDTNWHYLVAVFSNSTTHLLYIDGSLVSFNASPPTVTAGTPLSSFPDTDSTYIGEILYDTSLVAGPFNGNMDEVRISNSARSADWITTEYNNQNSPGNIGSPGFYTVGSETPVSSPLGFVITLI